jgi:transcriptional regulator with XRE-family HTH domain
MKWEEVKDELASNPEFREAYEDLEPEYQLVRTIIKQRTMKNMTQAELARKVGTRQSAIARLESGMYNPSLRFLKKVAKALDTNIVISFRDGGESPLHRRPRRERGKEKRA